jgi:hypothetical protein
MPVPVGGIVPDGLPEEPGVPVVIVLPGVVPDVWSDEGRPPDEVPDGAPEVPSIWALHAASSRANTPAMVVIDAVVETVLRKAPVGDGGRRSEIELGGICALIDMVMLPSGRRVM